MNETEDKKIDKLEIIPSKSPGGEEIKPYEIFIVAPDMPGGQIKLEPGNELTGRPEKLIFTGVSFKQLLLMNLWQMFTGSGMGPEIEQEARETYEFIEANFKELNITLKKDITDVEATYKYNPEIPEEEIRRRLNNNLVMFATAQIYNRAEEYLKRIRELATQEGTGYVVRGLNRRQRRSKEKAKSKKGKVRIRTGGHFIDNILKPGTPTQLSLFETMLQENQDKVLSSGTSLDLVNRKGEGIKVTKGEYRLLLCLSNLLHEKSQTSDPKGEDYYTGNEGVELIPYNTPQGDIELKSPKISFTLYEITKEFYGGADIGGENVKTVAKLLLDLSDQPDKKALIRYERKVDRGGGAQRDYYIERYDNLIKIATIGYKDFLEGKQIDERKELIVNLHPIFIDQIASKHIDLPLDLTKKMIEAYGSPNISEITTKLILDLSRGHSNRSRLEKDPKGNPIYCIGKEKLFYKIADNYLPPNKKRIPLIEEYFIKSTETAINIGLLLSYEIKPGNTGEDLYYFTLSKDW